MEVFKRDRREGYAKGFYKFLCSVKDGTEFLELIRPHSDKSGAAMRAGPIGVVPSIKKVKNMAKVQASVTHNTPNGTNAAVAAALMVHYFIYELGDKEDLGIFLKKQVPGNWDIPWVGKVGSKGWMSVRAAITAIEANDTLSGLLKDCVSFTGDVDTVATIALAAGSCSKEIGQDLPETLIYGLENGRYGREYLVDLDSKLMGLKC